ncbi:Histone deacetylase superfamily [Botryosphaeria dothidea]|uniref:histone deacetylase n=1 Tax=Botryosphaeria dothidea TaxID=55169 RepID=A0A8H4IYZ9_9PEZI|nr:Histone deacetylase superfamily [Botryosphaeria dothidea]KAF4312141.1 Histone deacetylase superfamily [Botryosphaeria dothidea]
MTNKTRVAYMYDPDIGCYDYEPGHCMKPFRIRMTHDLVMSYGLYKSMEVYRAKPASALEMTQFHTDEYIEFLQRITPDAIGSCQQEALKYDISGDCPVFDGLFEYCSISAGGSMEGAARLNRGRCDIAVNWAGGLHHAKKGQAGGFCYVNDIVLAILELLRVYQRVLYIDIDIHHGDGVEEAFYTTDRVMTCSFHKFGEFYPGTGHLMDIGIGKGKKYAVNVPLRDGITDEAYRGIFEAVISDIMKCFRPEAVVLQCGADSLSGDRLGSFNLSMEGHANCVKFVKSFKLPTMVLGGGGYSIRNVARTWAYETSQAVGDSVGKVLPFSDYYEYYCPEYLLDVPQSNMSNDNTPEYLEKIRSTISDRLRTLPFAPSVQMHDVPRHGLGGSEEDDDILADMDADENMDVRMTELQQDRQVANDAEFYDSDVEDEKNKHLVTRPEEAEALDEEMADVEDRESGEEASRKLTQPELPATNGDTDESENTRSGSVVVRPSETSAVVLDHASAEESSILPGTGNTTTPPRSPEPEEASAAEAATEVTDAAMEDTSEAPTAANVPTESIEPTTEVAETSTTAEAADPRSPSATPPRATE